MRSSTFPSRIISSTTVRRSLAFALVLSLALPASGFGQQKSYKRFYLAIGGALLVAIPAYTFTSEDAFQSTCSSKSCVGIVAGVIGGLIGFLVGSEMDKSYARRMAAGPSLEYPFRDIQLDLVPDRIDDFPGGAAVVGRDGARIVFKDGTVRPRAMGVRGIEDLAVVPNLDVLVLSTFSNLLGFSIVQDSAQGQVIDQQGGGSLELFQDRLAVASFDSLRLVRISRGDGNVALEPLASLENRDYVTDMAAGSEGRIGWVLMEQRLSSYDAELEKVGEVVLPAAGRTVRASGNRLAVAAGTYGVYVLDATDPARPRVVLHYTGVRFSYAADLEGERLFVAAGPEGVAVVDISGEEPKVLGVARHTEFATDVVVAGDGEVWILDRDGQSVQIADFGEPGDTGDRQ
jgi:hypothetical protein